MKRVLWVLAALMVGTSLGRSAAVPAFTFYVQLVRGSDNQAPPSPEAQLIGDKLGQRLHGVFKWKNYWEIKREAVTIKPGEKVRKQMSAQEEVEIEIPATGPRTMTVSIYSNGKLTRKRTQSIETEFYIAGGDKDATQPWFIVVRRDNPQPVDGTGSKLVATP
jgi:hypothetical protein